MKEEQNMLEPTVLGCIKEVARTKQPIEIATGGWTMLEKWNWIRRALMLEEEKEFDFDRYVEDQYILNVIIERFEPKVVYVMDNSGNTWLMTEYEAIRRELMDVE